VNAATIAREIAQEAIASIDLRARVRDALPKLPPPRARVTVLALGKAAPAMARGAIDRWGTRIDRVLVVTTDATDTAIVEGSHSDVTILRAAHPLPDDRSVDAANAMLEAARGSEMDLVLALISGGSSSLACSPPASVSLEEKRAVIAELLSAGAPIADVNVVRRHLSRIKGGGLARAALPGRTLSLVASDVLVDTGRGLEVGEPFHVGSGPSVPDPTSIDDARRALERWAPAWCARLSGKLTIGLAGNDHDAKRTRAKTIATPLDLLASASSIARARGFAVVDLGPTLDPVDVLAQRYARTAASMGARAIAIGVGEPSVIVPEHAGRGGRAGRLVLSVFRAGLPQGAAFAAIASDGVDGSSARSGAAIAGPLPEQHATDAADALARFDDATFLDARGASLPARPTGTNLLDLHVLVRE